MANDPGKKFDPAEAERVGADWLARRDRGLTAAEQDDYLQWLHEDARHAGIVARHQATFGRLRRLKNWQPAGSSEPNPELFKPVSARRRWVLPLATAVAAALLLGFFAWQQSAPSGGKEGAVPRNYLRVNERQALPDGSVVELRDGSRLEVLFSAHERRVRLSGGEAHFTVAKNPARPFIVEAGGVAVRAVGTAFNVRLDAGLVDVLVTEGKVRVETVPSVEAAVAPALPKFVSASQRTVVSRTATAEPVVEEVTREQVQEALAWQAPRLQFFETPLAEAVAEFNRRNTRRLVLADPALATIPIGGTFRIDNVEGFVRLLEVTLGLRSEITPTGEIALTRAP